MIKTGEQAEPGIAGVLMGKSACLPWTVNRIEVENLTDAIQKVIAKGGQQKSDIQNIPNVGKFVNYSD